MKFYTTGPQGAPVIVMLGGSFCPASAMAYLYEELAKEYFVIVPEYNGHYAGTTFTTRQGEASEAAGYLLAQGISAVRLLYGMSMGAEVGIELLSQLAKQGVEVQNAFFDGAPCIRLSKVYKALMHFKFKTMIKLCRDKDVDAVLNMGMLKKVTGGDTESLRPMIEAMKQSAQVLTDESIYNETECCYTFDFPAIPDEIQKRMHFFYSKEEKAYKTCYEHVHTAYPQANYQIVSGYGHMTYSTTQTENYLAMLRKICTEE